MSLIITPTGIHITNHTITNGIKIGIGLIITFTVRNQF